MVNVPIMSDTPEFSVQYYGNPFSFAETIQGLNILPILTIKSTLNYTFLKKRPHLRNLSDTF
jgi:hypothetical protein